MVGGGVPPFPGEISRAHKGLLLLDEFLEFKKNVIEALREPIEAGEINVSRLKNNKTFSADFLLLATTNLCPCGKWVPKKIISCQRSLVKCRFYLDKLSGPLLDRFEIVFVVDKQKQGKVQHLLTAEKLVEKATKFRLDTRKQIKVNSRLSLKELIMMIDSTELQAYMPENFNSQRRQRSTLSVARTIADLDESLEIKNYHMTEAMKLTYFPHKGFDEIY
jgi:magnesium chelatase family protein